MTTETHYVTQTGAGSQDGSSLANAWSLSDFHNSANWDTNVSNNGKIGPDDVVYFSGTFTDRVIVTHGGTASGHITLDGYEGGECDPINSECTSSAYLEQGMYIGNGTTSVDYLIVQDFRMTRDNSVNPCFRIYGGSSASFDHCIVRRNYVHETNGTMFYWYGGQYNIIQGNKFVHFGQNSTNATQGVNFIKLHNSLFADNEFGHDETNYPSGCVSANIIEVHDSHYLLFEYNQIYGAPSGGGIVPKELGGGNSNIIIRFNKIYDNLGLHNDNQGIGVYFATSPGEENIGMYVYGNNIYNNKEGLSFSGTLYSLYAWSNIISDNKKHGISNWHRTGTTITYVYIYNNTISRNNTLGETDLARSGFSLSANATYNIRNNILYNNNPTGVSNRKQFYSGPISVLEHNTYYHSGGSITGYYDGGYRSLATLKSTYNFEDDSPVGTEEDPLFTDPNGADNTYGTEDDNYTLQAGSPCIDDGADLSTTLTVDLSNSDSWFETETGYSTITMTLAEALDPDTDWSGQPSSTKILTLDRDTVGWDRGAYAYKDSSTTTLAPATTLTTLAPTTAAPTAPPTTAAPTLAPTTLDPSETFKFNPTIRAFLSDPVDDGEWTNITSSYDEWVSEIVKGYCPIGDRFWRLSAPNSASNQNPFFVLSEVGELSNMDFEVLVLHRRPDDNNTQIVPALRLTSDPTTCYYGGIFNDSGTNQLRKLSGGSVTTLSSGSAHGISDVTNSWIFTRLRGEGSTITVKSWEYGFSEPGSWQISTTDSDVASGSVGFMLWLNVSSYNNPYVDIAWFSAATYGAEAPMPPKPVFYSISPRGTSDNLLTGTTPSFEISDGIATIGTAQTGNIGVGCRITYNTSSLCYIKRIISTTQFEVVDEVGDWPSDVSAVTVDSITHEYNSISAAIAGADDANHLNTDQLQTGRYILKLPFYYDDDDGTLDTNSLTLDYGTDEDCYIDIYAPDGGYESFNNQRFTTVFDNTKALLQVTNSDILDMQSAYWRVRGLQIRSVLTTNVVRDCIKMHNMPGGKGYIEQCMFIGAYSDGRGGAIAISNNSNSVHLEVSNTLFYDFIRSTQFCTATYARESASNPATEFRFYNCTIENCYYGLYNHGDDPLSVFAATNVGQSNITESSPTAITETTCSSSTPTYENSGSDDFRLDYNDVTWTDQGTDLTGVIETVDLIGNSRPRNSTWDIGAYENQNPLTTFAPTTIPTTPAPTLAPTTLAPTTLPPTTLAPTTIITTLAPTTVITTLAPTTLAPTTILTTLAPTTAAPTTISTTLAPTTTSTTPVPTTLAPTTVVTTLQPTTLAPTTTLMTVAPTTVVTTLAPTTLPPTTLAPTTISTTIAPVTTLTTVAPATTLTTLFHTTSIEPTSVAPTTITSTTNAPTTIISTTSSPATIAPATTAPITDAPLTPVTELPVVCAPDKLSATDLLGIRLLLRQISGRHDLVLEDGTDNGADFYINEAVRYLDRLTGIQHNTGISYKYCRPGFYGVQFPYCRAVQEVYAANTSNRWKLTKVSLTDMTRYGLVQMPSARTGSTPLYYTPAITRFIPEDEKSCSFEAFIGFVDVMSGNSYEYNSVLLYPSPSELTVIEVRGLYYSLYLENDTDVNYWTSVHPFLLVMATMRQLEVVHRNTQGVNDWDRAIAHEVLNIEKDAIEQQSSEIDQMEG